ncbi:hypothetical protein AAC387_Pa06g0460 [Persea americana]
MRGRGRGEICAVRHWERQQRGIVRRGRLVDGREAQRDPAKKERDQARERRAVERSAERERQETEERQARRERCPQQQQGENERERQRRDMRSSSLGETAARDSPAREIRQWERGATRSGEEGELR